jgi:hypothetical protein
MHTFSYTQTINLFSLKSEAMTALANKFKVKYKDNMSGTYRQVMPPATT